MRLVLLTDTHLPTRARSLPDVVWDAVTSADVVVHAGDWVAVELLDALEAAGPSVVGVWGNNDGPELRRRLPEIARVELDGLRLAVTHETGPSKGREARCDRLVPDADVLVFGHSHIPWDSVTPSGMRLLNPGSPTDRRAQPTGTWMSAEIAEGRLVEVTLHRV